MYLPLMPNDYTPVKTLCYCIEEVDTWMSQNFALLEMKGLPTKDLKNLGVVIENDLNFRSNSTLNLLQNQHASIFKTSMSSKGLCQERTWKKSYSITQRKMGLLN